MNWLTGLGIWIVKLFTKSIKFIWANPRLVIEYCLIGIVVVMGCFTTTLWIKKQRIEIALANTETNLVATQGTVSHLATQISLQEDLNKEQGERIENLVELRRLDSTALTALVSNFRSLSASDQRVQKKLTELESKNAVVKDYLDQPIPPELACLHNDECEEAAPRDKDSQGDKNSDNRDPGILFDALRISLRTLFASENKRSKHK